MTTPSPTPGGGWVPVPDPTTLTTEAVEKATTQYRRELDQLRELIEARLDSMDRAAEAHLKDMGQLRRQIEEKIIHLGELCEEKFTGIDRRFDDRDARAAAHQENGEKALVAALESARLLNDLQNKATRELSEQKDHANADAINKAQAAANEQIKALDTVTATDRQALRDLIDDTRTRLTTMESLTRGISENKTERRLDAGQTIAVIGAVLVFISVAVTVIIATRGH